MVKSNKPPVSIQPCGRCGQFIEISAGNCWICNFPGPPKVIPRKGLSPLWKTIIAILMTMALGYAAVLALFVLCIFALSGGLK